MDARRAEPTPPADDDEEPADFRDTAEYYFLSQRQLGWFGLGCAIVGGLIGRWLP